MSKILVELQESMGSDASIANAAWTSTYDKDRREDKYDDAVKVAEIVLIPRHEWIQLMYQDETGTAKQAVLKGLYAVCAQHELEHLEGISFIENRSIPKYHRKMLAKKWRL